MAVNTVNCEHGFPQSVCRRCNGNDLSGLGENPRLAGPLDGLVEKIADNCPSAMQPTPTVLPSEHVEAGKGGEGGTFQITNAEFIAAVFTELPEGASAAVCSKPGNPTLGGWVAQRADRALTIAVVEHNNYLGCSSLYPGDDGSFKARKAQFAACHFLMLDDLGTKVPLDRLGDFELSWLIETSPGNYQGGIILDAPITDGAVAVRLLKCGD